jgi:uncharacterized protein YuzB (UPF0349 family)
MAEIEFCENNFTQGSEKVAQQLKDEGQDIEVSSCLGYCGDCAAGPFALVNDEFVGAPTADELYHKIKQSI